MTLWWGVESAEAAATLSVSSPASIKVGDTVNIAVNVNTGGQSANAFDATFHYPAGLFEGVRGTYSGSVCTLPISQPDPNGGTATISCGRPSGYTGSGLLATIVLKAIADGAGSFSLSACQVLANDGLGTDITGGCSGASFTVYASDQPTPTPSGATPTPTKTPKKSPTPSKTPTPGGSTAPVESSKTPPPTATPEGPAVETLPPSTPTPETAEQSAPQTEKRSIAQAIQDLLASFREFGSLKNGASSLIAVLLASIPFLVLAFGTVFIVYRLYMLERRRRRTLDRLFELELSELASLEGKLDLLSEKGQKGKQQFKEEFQTAKENILRQIKPNYGKPVEAAKTAPAPEEKKE